MKFPTEWKNKIHVPNHQPVMWISWDIVRQQLEYTNCDEQNGIPRAVFDQEKWWYSFIYNWDTVGLIRWWFMATMVYSRSCHHQGLLITVRTWFWSCHLITMLNGCVLLQRVVLPKKLDDKSLPIDRTTIVTYS